MPPFDRENGDGMSSKPTTSAAIAEFIGAELIGGDIPLTGVCAFDNIRPDCLLFVERVTPAVQLDLAQLPRNLVIGGSDMELALSGPHIAVPNPRLAFVRAARRFFCIESPHSIHPTAVIDPAAHLGTNVGVGAFAVIGPDVVVGDNTAIGNHVVLAGRTRIGRDCRLKSGCVIGEDGFGFVRDAGGQPLATPHFGGVTIGDFVSIGALSTIERGIFDDTVLEDHVKVDDLVQIGHNSVVARGACIAAGAILCGGARVGAAAWIAPNSNLLERKRVGARALIGLGSTVLGDVPDDGVFMGNPARKLRDA